MKMFLFYLLVALLPRMSAASIIDFNDYAPENGIAEIGFWGEPAVEDGFMWDGQAWVVGLKSVGLGLPRGAAIFPDWSYLSMSPLDLNATFNLISLDMGPALNLLGPVNINVLGVRADQSLIESNFEELTGTTHVNFTGWANLIWLGFRVTGPDSPYAFVDNIEIGHAVPEPAAWILLALGLAGIVFLRRSDRPVQFQQFLLKH